MIALHCSLGDGVNWIRSVFNKDQKSISWCVCVSSAGVPETDCGAPVHRQADRLSGSHAAAGRTPGRSPAHHKFPEKVSADMAS